ncbi:FAD-dependent oxidoreductase [Paludifilum halophilum]|uniref:MnmG N-terminal domain-containing protein n=1 Tax=Paludifilum halophilum TaxID=1642702 RepID=A0A235B6K5_9BACL|nr:FAD-dependent oxidoreductase [Paludifilum halophilum]OYD07920.1 hypothetical protein CHM34_07295 [Paludifilum halophilum]
MAYSGGDYDIIIISNGQAGTSSAEHAARMGKTALLLKLNPGAIASVMCSSSTHGSPHGQPVEELEAQLIQPAEDPVEADEDVQTQQVNVESHHSVYILQGTESELEPDLYSPEPLEETVDSADQPESTAEEKTPVSAETPDSDHRIPSSQGELSESDEPEEVQQTSEETENIINRPVHHPMLREREMFTRKKMLHRSPLPSREDSSFEPDVKEETESPSESPWQSSPFREREIERRRKMTRGHRISAKTSSPPEDKRPKEKESSAEETEKEQNPVIPKPDKKPDEKKRETVLPFQKGSSNMVIPMDQSRLKNRRAAKKREAPRQNTGKLEPFHQHKRKNVSEIPGSVVWEAKEKPAQDPSQTREEKQRPLRSKEWKEEASGPPITYEPFQKERPKEADLPEQNRSQREKPLAAKKKTGSVQQERTDTSTEEPAKPPQGLRRSDRLQNAPAPSKPAETPQPSSEGLQPFSQAKGHRRESSPFTEQEAARNVLRNSSSDTLKRDEIDIEDPFGQSYEEFMGPFSSSSGNPESEEVERRKIALRGLHNLINNLG